MDPVVPYVPKIALAPALSESCQLDLDILRLLPGKLRDRPVPNKTSRAASVTQHAIAGRFRLGAEFSWRHRDIAMPRFDRPRKHQRRNRSSECQF